ncbi:MAG: hypothetical protein KGI50_05610 [Patescibacteria group bacterium]|nr:hypothetical protein [Patescibacteria group bacterium]MDE2438892.1 hypothetical protein [Patescibacteria group bacterium]
MEPFKPKNTKKGPEAIIQEKIIKALTLRGWFIMETHGNLYQMGFPDLYATHKAYGCRWIEVKNPEAYCFTPAQLEFFPKLVANGTPIWVLISDSDDELKKIFKPQNWYTYLKGY